jgi:Bacterial protein of unknown function (HtrL_YibB)
MDFEPFKKFRQVIIWGFPLHSHTHSYIHGAWFKTFKYLGISVHWFHDKEFPSPETFDYTNSCFITEGWADDNIPVNSSSTYFVHIAKNPAKYAAARLIELRYNVLEIHDFNYDYVLPKEPIYISRETLYERVPDDSAVAGRRGRPVTKGSYEVAYMMWATDLLPHEINYEDANRPHTNQLFYVGSVPAEHPFRAFAAHATAAGLQVYHVDPWSRPVSYEENIELMKRSYCAPDFRSRGDKDKEEVYGRMNGTNHLEIGYIPCRVFKAISYGHTGITNSPRVKELLGDFVEYAEGPADVLPLVEKRKNDTVWRQAAMRHVAENHTFLQRARDLARILKMGSYTSTGVSALYDLGREAIDGRSMKDYIEWTEKTLRTIADPLVFYLDKSLGLKDRFLKARSGTGPILFKETSLQTIPMWKYQPSVRAIIDSKPRLKYPNDITNRLPAYVLVQYSKFGWIEEVFETDPFQTEQAFWIDAGFSRFYPTTKTYTSVVLALPQFHIRANARLCEISHLQADTYISTNECIINGGLFLAHPSSFAFVKREVLRIWEEEMMQKGRYDNEQIALALVCAKYPHMFQLIYYPSAADGTPDIFSLFFVSL